LNQWVCQIQPMENSLGAHGEDFPIFSG